MLGNPGEIRVAGEQRQLEANAELGEQGVDRPHLDPASSAVVAEVGGCDVIIPLWLQEGEGGEPLHDRFAGARSSEALKELLQDQAGREDGFAASQGSCELCDLGRDVGWVAPEGQGPDAGIDEDAQPRDRSPL